MTVRGAKFEFFDELMRRRFVLLLLGRGRGGEGGEGVDRKWRYKERAC